MSLEVGSIVEGKITGITKFGCFVALPEGKSGLVHISEVANTYVSEVSEHVQVGQEVKVKILNMSEDGKINLSIKKAEPAPERKPYAPRPQQPRAQQARPYAESAPRQPQRVAADPPSPNQDFEDRLKKFMQESDSRIADNRMYADRKQRSRRR